jgi:hypothetical protein
VNEDQKQAMFDDFMEQPSTGAEFWITRTIEAQNRDGLDRTFSTESLDMLFTQMNQWAGSRMLLHQKNTGLAPQRVRVIVTVECES